MRVVEGILLLTAAIGAADAAPESRRRKHSHSKRINVPLTMHWADEHSQKLHRRQNLAEGSGLFFTAPVTIGQQGVTYHELVDTGSTDLTKFNNNVNLGDATLVNQSKTCSEAYGPGGTLGQTSGWIFSSTYTIADSGPINGLFCLADVPAQNQGLVDGYIGLGLPAAGGPTVSGQTGNNPVTASGWDSFGLYLSSTDNGGNGQLTINDADASYYLGEDYWSYENVITGQGPGYWLIPYGTWQIGSSVGYPQNPHGFVDSGSSLIRMDYNAVNTIYGNIAPGALPGASQSPPIIDCSYKGSAPSVDVTFGSGGVYSIPSSNYIVQGPQGRCYVAIVATIDDSRPAVFGVPFIQTFYTWFGISDGVLGFNPSNG